MDNTEIYPAVPDPQLIRIVSFLHAASDAFDKWTDDSANSKFMDENEHVIMKMAFDFSGLESDLAALTGTKISFDLEAKYKKW